MLYVLYFVQVDGLRVYLPIYVHKVLVYNLHNLHYAEYIFLVCSGTYTLLQFLIRKVTTSLDLMSVPLKWTTQFLYKMDNTISV